MYKDLDELPIIGTWPKNEGERIEMPVSREEAPPQGESLLANYWKLSGMGARLERWWQRLMSH
jgi:hypothetical protein